MIYKKKSLTLLVLFFLLGVSLGVLQAQPVYTQTPNIFVPVAFGGSISVDIDNDKDLDLIFTGQNSNYQPSLFVYENKEGVFLERLTTLPAIQWGNLAAGDYDNDGDADILISGSTSQLHNETICAIFRNEGNFIFTQQHTFPGQSNSFVAWLDANNDEQLDFIVTGLRENIASNSATIVYKNNGTSFEEVVSTNLPNVFGGAMDIVDMNGDGKVDILVTGVPETALYLSNGDFTFTKDISTTFTQLSNGASRWADLDNDGDMDLLLTGIDQTNISLSLLYENKNGRLIPRTDVSLLGMGVNELGGTKLYDYNNDGRIDLLITGRHMGTGATHRIYQNNGAWSFKEMLEPVFLGLDNMAINTDDFDNDGDFDISFQGYYFSLGSNFPYSGYYKNTIRTVTSTNNSSPQPPLVTTFSERSFRKYLWLAWGEGSDAETPAIGLTYNFRLRDATRKIIDPVTDVNTGYLRTSNPANGYARIGFAADFPEGMLYYSVQSIDGARVASAYSTEKNFYHINGPEAVSAKIIDESNVKLTWIDNSLVESNYSIARSILPVSGFVPLESQPSNSATFTDQFNFLTETHYYYRISASNVNKISSYDSLELIIPERAANIQTFSINASRIQLQWEDRSNYEISFLIERRKSGNANFEVVTSVLANTEFYEDSGLEQGTVYEYRIWAMSANGGLLPNVTSSARTNYLPIGNNFQKVTLEDQSVGFTRVDFDTNFTDLDAGDQLTRIKVTALPQHGVIKLSGSPVSIGLEIEPELLNSLLFEPDPDFNGLTLLSVTASDGKDYSTQSWVIVLSVTSVNDPPAFQIEASKELDEDFQGSVMITPSLIQVPYETGDVLSFTISPNASDLVNIVLNPITGSISFTSMQDKFGTMEFTLTANDGQATSNTFSKNFIIIIRPINDPPELGVLDDIQIENGDIIPPIILTVTDVDNVITSEMLSAHSQNQLILKDEMININGSVSSNFFLNLVPDTKVGTTIVTVRIDDGEASATTSFLLEITGLITAVENSLITNVKVFPNPVDDKLIISFGEVSVISVDLTIIDYLGKPLVEFQLREKNTEIDTKSLLPGIYILKLVTIEGSTIQQKLIFNPCNR